MHSYGRADGPRALGGVGQKEREAKGLKGGVITNIFVAAFNSPRDTTLLSVMGMDPENPPEWIDHDVGNHQVDLQYTELLTYICTYVYHRIPRASWC
ncbi:hypothetical protein GGS26DRAFT_544140 [Hypomontagnella submonticulosa]|nr:hypothetical protein GGS26DRAFT_544140 [Hypomontagnella submonticulosa]